MNYTKEALRQCCRLAGRRNLYRVSRFLMHAARGDVGNDLLSNGERLVQAHVLRSSAGPATIFDVGANIGNWTASLLRCSEELQRPVRIHAFEPCQATFTMLSERARNWPQVELNHMACSRQPGAAVMHVYGNGLGTNSLVDAIDRRESIAEEVELTTIDLYCSTRGIPSIELVKIDAEGHDFDIIAGAAGMLDKHAICALQFEYNQRWIGARNYLRDVFDFLVPRGYVIGKLAGSHVEFYPAWQWEMENYTEGNYFACSESDSRRLPRRKPSWLPRNGSVRAAQTM